MGIEEKREALLRQEGVSTGKAAENMRDRLFEQEKRKELSQFKQREAEDRKAIHEAEVLEQREIKGVINAFKVEAAGKRAETIIAEKRERSSEFLDTWSEGVRRSERYARKKEIQQIKDAEESWSQYTERLSQIGTRRAEKSHHNGQEELKIKLQHDLKAELYDTQKSESRALA